MEAILLAKRNESENDPTLRSDTPAYREFCRLVMEAAKEVEKLAPIIDLEKHTVQNLILLGSIILKGGYKHDVFSESGIKRGLKHFARIAGVEEESFILPVSLDLNEGPLTVSVENNDEPIIISGQHEITGIRHSQKITKLYFSNDGKDNEKNPQAYIPSVQEIDQLKEGDLFILGPGSFYTSVLVNLLPVGIAEALKRARERGVINIFIFNPIYDNESDFMRGDINPYQYMYEQVEEHTGLDFADIFPYVIINETAQTSSELKKAMVADDIKKTAPHRLRYGPLGTKEELQMFKSFLNNKRNKVTKKDHYKVPKVISGDLVVKAKGPNVRLDKKVTFDSARFAVLVKLIELDRLLRKKKKDIGFSKLLLADIHATIDGIVRLKKSNPGLDLWVIGDMLDRGSEFSEMIRLVDYFTLGDHDLWFLGAAMGDEYFIALHIWMIERYSGTERALVDILGIDLSKLKDYAKKHYSQDALDKLKKKDALYNEKGKYKGLKEINEQAMFNIWAKIAFKRGVLTQQELDKVSPGIKSSFFEDKVKDIELTTEEQEIIDDLKQQFLSNADARDWAKILWRGKGWDIVSARPELRASREQEKQEWIKGLTFWQAEKHVRALLMHAITPIGGEDQDCLVDLKGKILVRLKDKNGKWRKNVSTEEKERVREYYDEINFRLEALGQNYEKFLAGKISEDDLWMIDSADGKYNARRWFRLLADGKFSPLYARSQKRIFNNYIEYTSEPDNIAYEYIGQKDKRKFKEGSAKQKEAEKEKKAFARLICNIFEVDKIIGGHISSKKDEDEIMSYAGGLYIKIDAGFTQKAGASAALESTERGGAVILEQNKVKRLSLVKVADILHEERFSESRKNFLPIINLRDIIHYEDVHIDVNNIFTTPMLLRDILILLRKENLQVDLPGVKKSEGYYDDDRWREKVANITEGARETIIINIKENLKQLLNAQNDIKRIDEKVGQALYEKFKSQFKEDIFVANVFTTQPHRPKFPVLTKYVGQNGQKGEPSGYFDAKDIQTDVFVDMSVPSLSEKANSNEGRWNLYRQVQSIVKAKKTATPKKKAPSAKLLSINPFAVGLLAWVGWDLLTNNFWLIASIGVIVLGIIVLMKADVIKEKIKEKRLNNSLKRLDHKDAKVRIKEVRALAEKGGSLVVALLVEMLNDEDWSVRKEAAKVLDTFKWIPFNEKEKIAYLTAKWKWDELIKIGAPAIPSLIIAIKGNYGNVISALGQIGDQSAVPALIDELEAGRNYKQVIDALINIGGKQAEQALKVAKDHDIDAVGKAVIEALQLKAKTKEPKRLGDDDKDDYLPDTEKYLNELEKSDPNISKDRTRYAKYAENPDLEEMNSRVKRLQSFWGVYPNNKKEHSSGYGVSTVAFVSHASGLHKNLVLLMNALEQTKAFKNGKLVLSDSKKLHMTVYPFNTGNEEILEENEIQRLAEIHDKGIKAVNQQYQGDNENHPFRVVYGQDVAISMKARIGVNGYKEGLGLDALRGQFQDRLGDDSNRAKGEHINVASIVGEVDQEELDEIYLVIEQWKTGKLSGWLEPETVTLAFHGDDHLTEDNSWEDNVNKQIKRSSMKKIILAFYNLIGITKDALNKILPGLKGHKYHPEIGVLPFEGISVIHNIEKEAAEEMHLSKMAKDFKKALKEAGLEKLFAFVDLESFHATIFDLVNEPGTKIAFANPEKNPKKLNYMDVRNKIESETKKFLDNYPEKLSAKVKISGVGMFGAAVVKMNLKFLDDTKEFTAFREALHKHLVENVDGYKIIVRNKKSVGKLAGHITIGYTMTNLSEDEIAKYVQLLRKFNDKFKDGGEFAGLEFELTQGEITQFVDMNHYMDPKDSKKKRDVIIAMIDKLVENERFIKNEWDSVGSAIETIEEENIRLYVIEYLLEKSDDQVVIDLVSALKGKQKNTIVGQKKISADATENRAKFEIVEGYINSRRGKFVKAVNEAGHLLSGVKEQGVSIVFTQVETDQTTESILLSADLVLGFIEKLEEQGKASKTLLKEKEEILKYKGDLYTDTIIASMIVKARAAKKQGQSLIVGLETGWIPGNEKGKLQYQAVSGLLKEINNLEDTLRSLGLDNVKVINADKESLSTDILSAMDETSTGFDNVIILASKDVVKSDEFAIIREGKNAEKPFIAKIDARLLNEGYQSNQESMDSQIFMHIIEMLTLTLEASLGKDVTSSALVYSVDIENKTITFLPPVEVMEYNLLRQRYLAYRKALQSA